MAAEVLFVAAKDNDMPRFLRAASAADVPTAALLLTTALIQVVLVVTLFSEDAFNFALDLTSALSLIPFLLAAGNAFKHALTRETYDVNPAGRTAELAVARSPLPTRRSCCTPPARGSSCCRSSSTRPRPCCS
jgi:arginine:ornithine antiporter/lysine permease